MNSETQMCSTLLLLRFLLLAVVVFIRPATSIAQSTHTFLCEDKDVVLEIEHPGTMQTMKIYDGFGYFDGDETGLRIYDLKNPGSPVLVAEHSQFLRVTDIVMIGRTAYMAVDNVLKIVDFSEPTKPILIGVFDSETVWKIEVDDQFVYGTARERFMVIDIQDPEVPVLHASFTAERSLGSLRVIGQYAIVCVRYGAYVVDITEPYSPGIINTLDTTDIAYDLDTRGDNVFLVCDDDGLFIFNVADPFEPVFLSQYDTPARNYDVSVVGDRAYLADGAGGVQILDISELMSPQLLGAYTGPVRDLVAWEEDILYVAEPGKLRVINVKNPPRGLIHLLELPGRILKFEIKANLAYLAVRDYGLLVFNVSDPRNPTQVGGLTTPSENPDSMFILDDTLYLTEEETLLVIGITDPMNPQLLGTYTADDLVKDVFVRDGLAFIANGDDGLLVVDVSIPELPMYVGSKSTGGDAVGIKVSGTYAYVADIQRGLRIYEIGFPSSPLFLGPDVEIENAIWDLEVRGNLVYLAGVGLSIYDMTNPALAVKLSDHYVGGSSHSIQRVGDTIYIPGAEDGLRILDVSDPYTPAELGLYFSLYSPYGIAIDGDIALVGAGEIGLQFVDINDYCRSCPIDFTNDGVLDVFDVFAYVDLFGQGSPMADLDDNMVIDIFDVFEFLDAYAFGCVV